MGIDSLLPKLWYWDWMEIIEGWSQSLLNPTEKFFFVCLFLSHVLSLVWERLWDFKPKRCCLNVTRMCALSTFFRWNKLFSPVHSWKILGVVQQLRLILQDRVYINRFVCSISANVYHSNLLLSKLQERLVSGHFYGMLILAFTKGEILHFVVEPMRLCSFHGFSWEPPRFWNSRGWHLGVLVESPGDLLDWR